jgi:ribosome-binding factor A
MKRTVAVAIAALCLASLAHAGSKKDIQKEIETTNKDLREHCGCTLKLSWSPKMDFTNAYGSDLAYNVEKNIESIGEAAVRWCQKDEDHRAKLCSMVKSVEVAEDSRVASPYTINKGPHVVTYIATKQPKQIMNHGDAWVETFLQTGQMPERSAD